VHFKDFNCKWSQVTNKKILKTFFSKRLIQQLSEIFQLQLHGLLLAHLPTCVRYEAGTRANPCIPCGPVPPVDRNVVPGLAAVCCRIPAPAIRHVIIIIVGSIKSKLSDHKHITGFTSTVKPLLFVGHLFLCIAREGPRI